MIKLSSTLEKVSMEKGSPGSVIMSHEFLVSELLHKPRVELELWNKHLKAWRGDLQTPLPSEH